MTRNSVANPTPASAWRIEFARNLSRIYSARSNVAMILLGGSPARGIADAYSDIDMIVYWTERDDAFISAQPLTPYGGDMRLKLHEPGGAIGMELYYFDTLIVEVGHSTVHEWDHMVSDVVEKFEPSPVKIKSIGGFYDAIPLFGEAFYREKRKAVEVFPHELAVRIINRNLGFFWPGCILNQGINRDEIVFFHDACCMTIKRLIGILAGLNHRFCSPIEPRWMEFELARMPIKPEQTWSRMRSIFEDDPREGVAILESLIQDVVSLVETHMPEADLGRFYETSNIMVQGTTGMPRLKLMP